ncbi:hypothetical protein A3A41_04050 [Candidatus Kaiserbacteria bacterium RIFCSPLOWO2_01_FULL_54_22]|nr:MAG: hypothetical protein A3A41_04050 [Candidatus Kaiserbacteria bacterium RIFCSPLOWO2_01_FULL_54_22]
MAIFLVAFGSLALGSTVFVTAKNAQLAAAIETTSKNCDAAKQAAAKGVSFGSQSGTGQNIADKCIAAVFDQSKVQPNEQNPRQNPKNYKCVGKSVKVSIDSKGKITESWNASASVPQGTCSTQYCDAKVCKRAKQVPGGQGLLDQLDQEKKGPGLLDQLDQEQAPKGPGLLDQLDQERRGPGLLDQLDQEKGPGLLDQLDQEKKGTGLLDQLDQEKKGPGLLEQLDQEQAPQPKQNKSAWDSLMEWSAFGSPQTLEPPENPLGQQNPPSQQPPGITNYSSFNSTFSAQNTLQNAPAANTCHFGFWGWCLWPVI